VVIRTLAQTLFGERKKAAQELRESLRGGPEMEKLESAGCVACASRAIAGQVLVVRAAKSCFNRLVLHPLPRLDAMGTTRRACKWMLQSRRKTVVSYPGRESQDGYELSFDRRK